MSPFCAVRGHYTFRFHFGPGRWLARIDYFDAGRLRPRAARNARVRDRRTPAGARPAAAVLALPLVHARRRRAHPLAGREALVQARAVLHEALSAAPTPDAQLMTSLDTSLFAPSSRMPAAARVLVALLARLAYGAVELVAPDGARRAFGPGGAPAPHARGVPAVLAVPRLAGRRRRAEGRRRRVRRKLHRRPLGHAGPHAAPHGAGGEPAGTRARVPRALVDALAAAPQALHELQHATAGAPQHRRALRPRQRLLPAVARPDDVVFVGAVRRRLHALDGRRATGEVRAAARRAGAGARRAHPRDRLRLGRVRGGRPRAPAIT